MTRQLSGMAFVAAEERPVHTSVSANDEQETRVLWETVPADVTIRTDESVTVTTMTGRQRELTPQDGRVYLTVGQDPLYVTGTVTAIEHGGPVSIGSTGDSLDVSAHNAGDGTVQVTHEIADRRIDLSPSAGETERRSVSIPEAYRQFASPDEDVNYPDRGHRVESTVTVEGETTGWLFTRVRPDPVDPQEGPTKPTTTDSAGPTTATQATETVGTTTSGAGFGFSAAVFAVAVAAFGLTLRRRS